MPERDSPRKARRLFPLALAALLAAPPSAGGAEEADRDAYEAGLAAALDGDFAAAFQAFSAAAEAGLDLAQYNLGILYFTGRGVARDPAQAFRWTEAAALQGHLAAQANLASLYLEGDGVERDAGRGVAWLVRAGRAGHAGAAFSLAGMYFEGEGVDRDRVAAHTWASQAEHLRHEGAGELKARIARRLNARQLGQARRMFARWRLEPPAGGR